MKDPLLYINYLESLSYLGIFVVTMLSGVVIPLPEEIILLIAGYLASAGFLKLIYVLLVTTLALLISDNVLYHLSRSNSHYITRLRAYVLRIKFLHHESWIHDHWGKTIFFTRFLPGLRFVGPILSGTLKVDRAKFQFYNFLALIVYTPLVVILGYIFHERLAVWIIRFQLIRHVVFLAILIALGIAGALYLNRRLADNADR